MKISMTAHAYKDKVGAPPDATLLAKALEKCLEDCGYSTYGVYVTIRQTGSNE